MKEKKVNKTIVKMTVSLIISIISFTIFITLLKIKEETFEYAYNVDENMDYFVYIKPNNYIQEKYLSKNNDYIANIVDYINIQYNYNFNASNYANIRLFL